jgi:hypothetical protein
MLTAVPLTALYNMRLAHAEGTVTYRTLHAWQLLVYILFSSLLTHEQDEDHEQEVFNCSDNQSTAMIM